MERLPAFKSGHQTPPTQRAPAARTVAAAGVRPEPVTTSQPQRPSTANGARPKTSVGGQKGAVGGSVLHEDAKSSGRGSLPGTSRR